MEDEEARINASRGRHSLPPWRPEDLKEVERNTHSVKRAGKGDCYLREGEEIRISGPYDSSKEAEIQVMELLRHSDRPRHFIIRNDDGGYWLWEHPDSIVHDLQEKQ